MGRRLIYLLLIGLGLVAVYLIADRLNAPDSEAVAVPRKGNPAPEIELKTPSGETVKLSDYRGQAVLVNLWATWCPPCRAEMPTIEAIYNEYKDQGFVVLAVDMTYQDDAERVPPFVAEQGLTYPILLDETGDVAADYQMLSLPTSFFIDREGIIQDVVMVVDEIVHARGSGDTNGRLQSSGLLRAGVMPGAQDM
jgi:peroxiredoxin